MASVCNDPLIGTNVHDCATHSGSGACGADPCCGWTGSTCVRIACSGLLGLAGPDECEGCTICDGWWIIDGEARPATPWDIIIRKTDDSHDALIDIKNGGSLIIGNGRTLLVEKPPSHPAYVLIRGSSDLSWESGAELQIEL